MDRSDLRVVAEHMIQLGLALSSAPCNCASSRIVPGGVDGERVEPGHGEKSLLDL